MKAKGDNSYNLIESLETYAPSSAKMVIKNYNRICVMLSQNSIKEKMNEERTCFLLNHALVYYIYSIRDYIP